MVTNRYFRHFDFISFFLILIISLIGLFSVYSATYMAENPYSIFFKKQFLGLVSGIILYFLCCFIDYRTLMRMGYWLYLAIIALLFFTLIKGSIAMGGRRWINLFFFKAQPSELAKLLFPAYAAYYFHTEDHKKINFYDFIPILLTLIMSFILIAKQPDLGTAIIVSISGIFMLWLAGLSKKFFITCTLLFALTAPISWQLLKPYQKKRILVFLGEGNVKKERYQIEQAKIAIGSGGLYGKGFCKGTQNKLQFLPEGRTDCIFAVICEEWGFLGAMLLLFLYLLLFARLLFNVIGITSSSIQLLAIGIILHLFSSALINIAMVLGLMPVVGIPLPLVSYGLSNLWISWISLGWFQAIVSQRQSIGEYKIEPALFLASRNKL